jgi:replication factor A1
MSSSPGRGPFSSPTQLSQATLFPISSLNPYQSKWTIRVRVASKPSIREWSNSRGSGKVFNIDLIDESVSMIATCLKL